MTNKLIFSAFAGMAVVGALALAPLAVNAEEAPATRGNGYGLHNGTGSGQQGSGRQASLESRAKALGMSVEELNKALETKTMLEVAADKGLSTEQFQAKMREASAARWQARGLTATEVQERTAAQAERQADCDGSGNHQGQGGFGRNQRAE